jgi:hypothetical protein
MGVSNEAKNVIPLKFLRNIKNKNVFPLLNSIRGHTVYCFLLFKNRKIFVFSSLFFSFLVNWIDLRETD